MQHSLTSGSREPKPSIVSSVGKPALSPSGQHISSWHLCRYRLLKEPSSEDDENVWRLRQNQLPTEKRRFHWGKGTHHRGSLASNGEWGPRGHSASQQPALTQSRSSAAFLGFYDAKCPFSMSWKAGLVVMNSLSFRVSGKAPPSSLPKGSSTGSKSLG